MIKKTIFQALISIAAFLMLWFGLSQIDFMKAFEVEKNTADTETKLGRIFWETIQKSETVVRNDSVNKLVDRIVTRITDNNNLDRDQIKVHVIEKSDMNAFAMPGNHLIIFTGLISACKNESELAGVIGHEIAHIEKKHVMKKLVKEVGLSFLLSMATGGQGSQTVGETAKLLSSSAYDRKLESEADFASVDYLIDAEIDPAPFADFLFNMSTEESLPAAVYWISTHPESQERAEAIAAYIEGKKMVKKQILTPSEWTWLKKQSAN